METVFRAGACGTAERQPEVTNSVSDSVARVCSKLNFRACWFSSAGAASTVGVTGDATTGGGGAV